jgi:hypothetical protein
VRRYLPFLPGLSKIFGHPGQIFCERVFSTERGPDQQAITFTGIGMEDEEITPGMKGITAENDG